MKFNEYCGMSYERASREADRLIAKGWFGNFERLAALRTIMEQRRGAVPADRLLLAKRTALKRALAELIESQNSKMQPSPARPA